MAQPRTPLNVLDLNGRLAHDRKRLEGREPPPEDDEPIGTPPQLRLLTFEESWATIVDMCPAGVLRKRDRAWVQEAARLHMEIHNAQAMAEMTGAAFAHIHPSVSKLYQSYLSKLGASPVDANHVSASKGKAPSNEFD
jgi:hypothetical protein